MLRLTELRLPLDHAEPALRAAVLARLGVDDAALASLAVFKRSVDARKQAAPVFIYTVDCALAAPADEVALLESRSADPHLRPAPDTRYCLIAQAPADFAAVDQARPVVVGFGPCGIFAALILAQMGLRPVVLERGKAVRERTKDTWDLWRKRNLHPESNVQFGEGGAGTFSDGKLWSQISDPRHLTRKVLAEFIKAGAPEEIGWIAKPHIGTFRLVGVVEKMRAEIEALGGEVRFGARVVDLLIEHGGRGGDERSVRGLTLASGETLRADCVVLALGHSARDTFAMLHARGVAMDAKPFSIGFRIEHPQGLIDRARYGRNAGHPRLGAADYKLVHHAGNGRSVYSFCMCPGGTVVAATSEVGRVVTNGMSQYSRNERNANAGIVVGITPEDCMRDWAAAGSDADAARASGPARVAPDERAVEAAFGEQAAFLAGAESAGVAADEQTASTAGRLRFAPSGAPGAVAGASHPLAGIAFQRRWESRAFALGGADYSAPAQLVGDFLRGQASTVLGNVLPSYQPGVRLTDLGAADEPALPAFAIDAIREALPAFERQIAGYAMTDAVLTGVETRTSSPLRIGRGRDFQSVNTRGLYPAGEGAGYAGGIMSAGVDGIEVAEALGRALLHLPE